MAGSYDPNQVGIDADATLAWYNEEWLGSWNTHDEEWVLRTLAEDATFDDSAWRTKFVGAEGWKVPIGQLWSAFPDLRFELVSGPYMLAGEPGAAFIYKGLATMTGALGKDAATNKTYELEACEIFTFRDGLIKTWWNRTDMVDLKKQVGLL